MFQRLAVVSLWDRPRSSVQSLIDRNAATDTPVHGQHLPISFTLAGGPIQDIDSMEPTIRARFLSSSLAIFIVAGCWPRIVRGKR